NPGNNPTFLYYAFISDANFPELAGIIFNAFPQGDILSFIRKLDPQGFYIQVFIQQAVKFNLMNKPEETFNALSDIVNTSL
ncbi:MAG: hypothetical protein Q8O12_06755, partial [Candidatus Omnitrophota bacterium]|nr:hypothetical protein [Candidatus Omnitrophota bacterium]